MKKIIYTIMLSLGLITSIFGGTVTETDNFIFTEPIKTTVDYLSSSPADDDLSTAGWVRSLSIGGDDWFFTTTISNFAGVKTTNFVALSTVVPVNAFTNTIPSPVASDTYLAGGIVTQLQGQLRSPITFEMFLNRVGGNATTVIPVHPEVYYILNNTTNHLGDYDTPNQNVTLTTPTRFTFTVPFVNPNITSAVHVVAYLKSGTVSGTAAGLNIVGGNGYGSRLNIDAVSQADVDKVYNMRYMTNWNGSVVDGNLNFSGYSGTNTTFSRISCQYATNVNNVFLFPSDNYFNLNVTNSFCFTTSTTSTVHFIELAGYTVLTNLTVIGNTTQANSNNIYTIEYTNRYGFKIESIAGENITFGIQGIR